MYIYAVLRDEETNKTEAGVFCGYEELNRFTFSPVIVTDCIIPFSVKGTTYKEKQSYARSIAVEYSLSDQGGLSMGEYALLDDFFEKIGRRYGLLREFRENAIC